MVNNLQLAMIAKDLTHKKIKMTCLHKKLYHTQKNQAAANIIPFIYSVRSDNIRTLTILTGLAFLAGL